MRFLGVVGIFLVSVACNNAPPTATGYKEQLGAPAAVTGNNSGNATGDSAKGQTALAACTGCHADGGAAHKLAAADADSIGKGNAGKNPVHGSVPQAAKDAFANNAADMAAFLKGGTTGGTPAAGAGNAANGATLLKGKCEGCHVDDGSGIGPRLDSTIKTLDGKAGVTPMHGGLEDNFTGQNALDILAALAGRAP